MLKINSNNVIRFYKDENVLEINTRQHVHTPDITTFADLLPVPTADPAAIAPGLWTRAEYAGIVETEAIANPRNARKVNTKKNDVFEITEKDSYAWSRERIKVLYIPCSFEHIKQQRENESKMSYDLYDYFKINIESIVNVYYCEYITREHANDLIKQNDAKYRCGLGQGKFFYIDERGNKNEIWQLSEYVLKHKNLPENTHFHLTEYKVNTDFIYVKKFAEKVYSDYQKQCEALAERLNETLHSKNLSYYDVDRLLQVFDITEKAAV